MTPDRARSRLTFSKSQFDGRQFLSDTETPKKKP